MYYVYVLISFRDEKLYIGFTTDLKKRVKRHFNKEVIATKYRLPLKLIHYECFINKQEAKSREKYLKSGYGRKNLYQMLKHTLKKYHFKYLQYAGIA